MSGTSADGIDSVLAEVNGHGSGIKARVLAHVHRPFTPGLRRQILHVSLHGTVAEICELNFLLGEHFARAALAVAREAKRRPIDIDVIGSHGQTIHHLPNSRTPSTLQIGEPAIIAERTGITTVADFRVRDMAAGGQGAPLVPYADWALFTDDKYPRILQNIGGIANLTFLPPGARLDEVMAFDTGPGNMVIDAIVATLSKGRLAMDRGGAWAARGIVSLKLLAEMMSHPFLSRRPPRTTGREEFGEMFVLRVLASARKLRLQNADTLATATAFTARSIAAAYKRWIYPRLRRTQAGSMQIILGGGGAKNRTLKRMLLAETNGAEFLNLKDLGVAESAKEALAFAILAHETLSGNPGNVPSATGAKHPVILGKIVPAN